MKLELILIQVLLYFCRTRYTLELQKLSTHYAKIT